MKDLDSIILEILDDFIDSKNIDIEAYCKEYPQHRNAILAKFRTAKFIKSNFQDIDLSGKKLGEYLILQELGRGGMGIVFLGINPALSRLSAIKVLAPSFINDRKALKNFQEEAKTIAKFNHPNIVPIYSISEEKGIQYIAMGYISGISLKKIIEQLQSNKQSHRLNAVAVKEMLQGTPIEEHNILQKSITLKRGFKFWEKSYFQFIATICAEIADALSYAHQNKIIHGDLKLSNILLTNEAIPIVVDFGLSKDIKKIAYSKGNEFAGTLAYAAPEQINENIFSEKTDIWSLGATIYELLTFRNPFIENTAEKTVNKILKFYPLPLRHYNKKIPIELEAIVLKCLGKKPENRYCSMAELSQDLNNYVKLKPIKAKPAGLLGKTVKLIRRHPLLSFLTASLIFTLIISSILIFNKKISDLMFEAGSLYDKCDYDKSILGYNKALKLIKWIPFNDKKCVEIYYSIGNSYLDKPEYEKAIIYYNKALEIDPKCYAAIVGLAELYYEKKNFDESLKFYKVAIKLRPDDRYNYYSVGRIFLDEGMADSALEYYRFASNLAPEDFDTLREIASVIKKIGLSKKEEIEAYLKNKSFNRKQIESVLKILQENL